MRKLLLLGLILFGLGYVLPEASPPAMPVQGAKRNDWNPKSFWYYPWGRSITHKGVDIFARYGTPVRATTSGLVWKTGFDSMGGNFVLILGAKWRFHYYAHLAESSVKAGAWVQAGQNIGAVGDSGNAKGKSPHLHYSVITPIPLPWRYNSQQVQGHLQIFYLDPTEYLERAL